MRSTPSWYQVRQEVTCHFPDLRPAQQDGLALWVYGAITAMSACEHAVLTALCPLRHGHALRQRLRAFLVDGADKAAPCHTQVDVTACFAPLLRWVLAWWQGDRLALAVDATAHGDTVVALVVSVLYRRCALPVAWAILPANQPGAWMPRLVTLLAHLAPAVPPRLQVLVLADRGLWSPTLWTSIRAHGWHPLLRVQQGITFQPAGQGRQVARSLVPGPGYAWVGAGVAFQDVARHQAATLLVWWAEGQEAPCLVLTDLAPDAVDGCWYALRLWIELGFRVLKTMGWQWQRTRRSQPIRVARHWLVLAVATLVTLAVGTRAEDADALGVAPAHLRTPPPARPTPLARRSSVFALGRSWLAQLLPARRWWRRLWLSPEPWPAAPSSLQLTIHLPPPPTEHTPCTSGYLP